MKHKKGMFVRMKVRHLFICFLVLIPTPLVVQCKPSTKENGGILAPITPQALTPQVGDAFRKSASNRRYGFLDGFGTSGIKQIDGNDLASVMPKRRLMDYELSSLLTASLFGTFLSRPLWNSTRHYWIAVGGAVFLYLLESLCSKTRRYLSNMLTPQQVQDLIHKLRDTRPVIRWHLECYHYDYHRVVSEQDGKQVVREVRTKVVTHRASQEYLYDECIDWTYTQGLLDALDYDPDTQNPFLRISLGTLFLFHDIVCYKDYLSQLGNFRLREGNRDHYTDTRTSFEVEGCRQKILAVRTVIGVHGHIRVLSFWLCTLLGLTVPYRLWFSGHCDDVDVLLLKEVIN